MLCMLPFLQGEWEDALSADLAKYEECSWKRTRLPSTVVPVAYELSLYGDMMVRLWFPESCVQ